MRTFDVLVRVRMTDRHASVDALDFVRRSIENGKEPFAFTELIYQVDRAWLVHVDDGELHDEG